MEKKNIRKQKISVALAVYNEDANLDRCLSTVKFADEIIIVDGGSTDKTVDIAKKYGAKVIIANNPPIFHINKQKAIEACQGEWILQLDADEEVPPELEDELLSIAQSEKSDYCGYYVSRKNQLLGRWMKHGGTYPDYVVRFFKKGKGFFPCKSVHEQIIINGTIGYLKNSLIHQPYPTFSEYLRKANTYTSLTSEEYRKQNVPISANSFFYYMIWYPLKTFCTLFLRNKGFFDGFPGFVWALFSAFHHSIAFIKYWESKR